MVPDPLRLAFCPACDYALAGLPPEGLCPECGRPYDQAYVVLRGRPAVDGTDRYGPVARRFWMVVTYGTVLMIGAWIWRHAREPFVLILCAYGVALAVWQCAVRLWSPRPGEVLVWMSPAGMGQQHVGDPASWVGRLLPMVPHAASVLLGAVLFVVSPTLRGASFSMLLTPLMSGMALWSRPKPAVPADGVRPALYAWRSFADVTLDLRGRRPRLLGRHDTWVAKRQRTVAIDLQLEPGAVEALQVWLRDWRSGATRSPPGRG